MKKDWDEKTKFSKILPNNHRMPHRTSSTRNDYERKINYYWPYKTSSEKYFISYVLSEEV